MNKLLAITCLLLFVSCSDKLLIEKSDDLRGRNPSRIICISPRFYFTDKEQRTDLKQIRDLNELLALDVKRFSARNKLSVSLLDLDASSDISFYEDLLKLKRNVLAVNFSQSNPLDHSGAYGSEQISTRTFVYPPKLSFEFSDLSGKFGTPYFSCINLFYEGNKTLLYHVVVDTDQAQTIYRELKTVNGHLNNTVLHQMIYDSYYNLSVKLKK